MKKNQVCLSEPSQNCVIRREVPGQRKKASLKCPTMPAKIKLMFEV